MKDKTGIKVNSSPTRNIEKIMLNTGEVIDLKEVCSLMIVKDRDFGDKSAFLINLNILNKNNFKALSNQAFVLANALRIMDITGVELDEAIEMHKNMLNDQMESGMEN